MSRYNYGNTDYVFIIDDTCTNEHQANINGVDGNVYVCATEWDDADEQELSDELKERFDECASVGKSAPVYAPEITRTAIFVPSNSMFEIDFAGGHA